MEEIKWFSNVMCGVSTARSLGFGLDLGLESAKLLANDNSKEGMAHPKSATKSQRNNVTSLIGHTWRKWNGSAVSCLAFQLQKALLWVGSGWNLPNFWPMRAWPIQNQPHRAIKTM
jgi:hypothetical protein